MLGSGELEGGGEQGRSGREEESKEGAGGGEQGGSGREEESKEGREACSCEMVLARVHAFARGVCTMHNVGSGGVGRSRALRRAS